MRFLALLILASGLLGGAAPVHAFDLEESLRELHVQYDAGDKPDAGVTQNNGGKTLGEAIEQVRRKHKGGRILSAETRVNGNREVHYIKVLTKDGKVKTERVNGRRLDR